MSDLVMVSEVTWKDKFFISRKCPFTCAFHTVASSIKAI